MQLFYVHLILLIFLSNAFSHLRTCRIVLRVELLRDDISSLEACVYACTAESGTSGWGGHIGCLSSQQSVCRPQWSPCSEQQGGFEPGDPARRWQSKAPLLSNTNYVNCSSVNSTCFSPWFLTQGTLFLTKVESLTWLEKKRNCHLGIHRSYSPLTLGTGGLPWVTGCWAEICSTQQWHLSDGVLIFGNDILDSSGTLGVLGKVGAQIEVGLLQLIFHVENIFGSPQSYYCFKRSCTLQTGISSFSCYILQTHTFQIITPPPAWSNTVPCLAALLSNLWGSSTVFWPNSCFLPLSRGQRRLPAAADRGSSSSWDHPSRWARKQPRLRLWSWRQHGTAGPRAPPQSVLQRLFPHLPPEVQL